jgi:hypothetical protein
MFRVHSRAAVVVLGTLLLSAAAGANTLTVNLAGGSIADPITDSGGTVLPVGDEVFVYASTILLDESDLFTTIFRVTVTGLEFVSPANVVEASTIGSGIVPPVNEQGRWRSSLALGNVSNPVVPDGSLLYLIAVDDVGLSLAMEAGISPDAYQVSFPPMEGAPNLDDFTYTSFATVPIPEPGTILLMGSGLLALAARRRRAG